MDEKTPQPTLRQNVVTGEWSILSTSRAKRPHGLLEAIITRPKPAPVQQEPSSSARPCPFCPGNEERDLEVSCHPAEPELWQVRVVRNRFPAVLHPAVDEELRSVGDELKPAYQAIGHHEVIVVTREHNRLQALDTDAAVGLALAVAQERTRVASRSTAIAHVCVLHNHGPRAGASLQHPHCQIITTPIVPPAVLARMTAAKAFYARTQCCAVCATIRSELAESLETSRVVASNSGAVAWVPWAAQAPFQVWIAPRDHCASFVSASAQSIAGVASLLRRVLRAIYEAENNPDLNYCIETPPLSEPLDSPHLHWCGWRVVGPQLMSPFRYINIVPKTTVPAGYELGTDICINPQLPEASALVLRHFCYGTE